MKVNQREITARLKKLGGIIGTSAKGTPGDGVLFRDGYLYATNHELGIKTMLDTDGAGECFIIPKSAIEFIGNMPDGEIEITGDDNVILIKCGSIKNKYRTLPAGDYPETNDVLTDENKAEVNSVEFLDALSSVMYAVDENIVRQNLRGILLDAHSGKMNIVGCSSARLAWNTIDYNGNFKVMVPKQAVKQLLSVGIKGGVSFAWDDKRIVFKTDEYEVYSRILGGEPINYKVLVVEHENKTVINRKSFAECLKRSLICYGDKVKSSIKCSFNADDMTVSVIEGLSEYEETLKLRQPIHDPIEIGFNAKYLLEAVSSFAEDELNISFGNPLQPVIIKNGNLTALVSPVRLQG